MNTVPITINGKKFTAREFLLEDYPDCMESFDALRSKDRKILPAAFLVLLAKASDVPSVDAKLCTWREMMEAVTPIMEVNGMRAVPKAAAEAEKTDTASEPELEPSAS